MPALHPFAPEDAGRWRVAGECRWRDAGRLAFHWQIEGELAALRTAPRGPPVRTEALWRHTCFEAFIATATSGAAYWELNLATSGGWAMYAFSDYRRGRQDEGEGALELVELVHETQRLRVEAELDCARLGPRFAAAGTLPGTLDVGLAAVLEPMAGGLGYWALAHTAERADFHRRDAFVLQLPPWGAAVPEG